MTRVPPPPIKLYRFALSGHSHRAQLMLSLLALPHELIEVDLLAKQQKTASFLQLNPFGQVPVIDDAGTIVADSNAILVYLASRYDDGAWLPRAPGAAAQVQRWLSLAAGPLAFGAAAARVARVFGAALDAEAAKTRAHALFTVTNDVLSNTPFLCGSTPTIADIAHYTYTAHAPEGDVMLEPYRAVRAWLARIEALPGFVPMKSSSIPRAAA